MEYKFDKKKSAKSLENLSKHVSNPLNNDDVFEIVQLINYCEDLEKIIERMDSKLVEISDMMDPMSDCKGVCDKGDTPCHYQCTEKGYWKNNIKINDK